MQNVEIIVSTTFITIDKIKKECGKNSGDCLLLYFELQKHSRMQKTNTVYALNDFLMKGLSWGRERLQKAKKNLLDCGLITEVQRVNKEGKFEGKYIQVNFILGEEKAGKTVRR